MSLRIRILPLVLIVAILIILPIPQTRGSAVLIADMTMSVMVELSSRHPFCKMHTDRGDIQRMLLKSDQRRIRQVPRESVMELEEVCKQSGSYGHEYRGALGFIYPGTKWCGPGNTASNYDDLGSHIGEDRCCREHDNCPDVLNVNQCKRGLCNTGTFTRSHCDCDARLRRCLQDLNTETANTLGAIFYNVVQVTCFQERSPCSAQQRFEDFVYRTAQCELVFRPADYYVPRNMGNLIEKILSHPYGLVHKLLQPPLPPSPSAYYNNQRIYGRSLDQQDGVGTRLSHFSRRLGVKLASVGLAAVNIVREIVKRPSVIFESIYTPVRSDLPSDFRETYQTNHAYYSPSNRYSYSRSGGGGGGYNYYHRSYGSPNNFGSY